MIKCNRLQICLWTKKPLPEPVRALMIIIPTPFFEPHTPYNSFDLLHKQALLHELFFVLFSFFDFLLQKALQISQKNDFDPFCSTHISSYEYRQMISTPFFLALPSIESDGPTYLITFHHAHSNNLRHRNNQRNRPNTNQKNLRD